MLTGAKLKIIVRGVKIKGAAWRRPGRDFRELRKPYGRRETADKG